MRGLISARVRRSAGASSSGTDWRALESQVPCLSPAHAFSRVTSGPERMAVFIKQGMEDQGDSLQRFLATFRPSRASCADVAWICVSVGPESAPEPGDDDGRSSLPESERIEEALREAGMLLKRGESPTHALVARLARRWGILRGKWLLFPGSATDADRAWELVARAAVEGRFFGEAKVSPCRTDAKRGKESAMEETSKRRGDKDVNDTRHEVPNPEQPSPSPMSRSTDLSGRKRQSEPSPHVICVYTPDYLDARSVEQVAVTLASIGLPASCRSFRYKPDMYTHLGVYASSMRGQQRSCSAENEAPRDPLDALAQLKPCVYTASSGEAHGRTRVDDIYGLFRRRQ